MPYVDAYDKYHIPIVKILRAYSRIDFSKKGLQFSDATIDQINSNHLSSWGFMKKYSRWYYKDHYVEMGDLLPLPKELEPEHPMAGQELKIIASLNGEINCGKIKFSVSSNIPDGTPLLFTLRGKGYCAQCKSVVDNGVLVSEWFSDHGDAIKMDAIPLNYRHQYIVSCQKEYSVFLGKETEIYMGHALNSIQLAVIQSTALSA